MDTTTPHAPASNATGQGPLEFLTAAIEAKRSAGFSIADFERVEAAMGAGLPAIFEELTGFDLAAARGDGEDGKPRQPSPEESQAMTRRALKAFSMKRSVALIAAVCGVDESAPRAVPAAKFGALRSQAIQLFVDSFSAYTGQEDAEKGSAEGNAGTRSAPTS